MEQDVGLIVLKHLGHKFNVHVLDVDFLDLLVSDLSQSLWPKLC